MNFTHGPSDLLEPGNQNLQDALSSGSGLDWNAAKRNSTVQSLSSRRSVSLVFSLRSSLLCVLVKRTTTFVRFRQKMESVSCEEGSMRTDDGGRR